MGAQESKKPNIFPQQQMSEAEVRRLKAHKKQCERERQQEVFMGSQIHFLEVGAIATELRRDQNAEVAQRKLQEVENFVAQKKLQEETFVAAQKKLQEEAANLAAQKKLQEEAFVAAQRKLQEEANNLAAQKKLQEETFVATQKKLQEEAANLAAQRRNQEVAFITAQRKLQEEAAKKARQEEAARRAQQEEAAKRARQEEAVRRGQQEEAAKRARQEEAIRRAQQEEAAKRARQEEAVRRAQQEEAAKKARQEEAVRRAQQEEAAWRARQEEAAKKARQEEAVRRAQQEEATWRARQEEAAKKARQEEAARRAQQEAAKRTRQEEAAKRTRQEEAARRARQEEAAKRARQEEAAKRVFQEEAARRVQQEEATRRAHQEEETKRARQEEAARRAQQEEAAKRACQEEAVRRARQEEAANLAALKKVQAFIAAHEKLQEDAAKKVLKEETANKALQEEAAKKALQEEAAKKAQHKAAAKRELEKDTLSRTHNLPEEADVFRWCATCFKRSTMKMFECENGHGSCQHCKIQERECGICQTDLTDRSSMQYDLDNHVAQTKVPCPHKSKGCVLKLRIADMAIHMKECPFKKQDCPLAATHFPKCQWKGETRELWNHFSDVHPKNLLGSSLLGTEMQVNTTHGNCKRHVRLVKLGFYFILHLKISEVQNKVFIAVQLIGTKISAKNCVYEIHVYDKSDDRRTYMYTDNCRSSIEDIEDVFEAGECAVLPMRYAHSFFNNGILTFKFFIKRTKETKGSSMSAERNQHSSNDFQGEVEYNDLSRSNTSLVQETGYTRQQTRAWRNSGLPQTQPQRRK